MSKEPSAKGKKITTITTLYDVCDRDRQVKYSTLGPDEVLAKHPRSPSIIPVRHRSHEFKLPDSELLKVIHYYVAKKYPGKRLLFDETALLTMGILVEDWVEKSFNDQAHDLYSDVTRNHRRKRLKKLDKNHHDS